MANDDDEAPLLGQMKVEGSSPKLYMKDYVAGLVSFVMIGLGIAAIVTVCVYQTQILYEYSIVLDAGSTHTDLMVYRWSKEEIIHQTGLVKQIGSCTSKGGSISSYSKTNPNQAGESLQNCIDDTAKKLIPSYLHHKSPIYLGATAGMRLVEKVDKKAANAIMQSVRQTLHKSNFKFEDNNARIITGEEEGLSSWVTVNYLRGTLLYREILSNASRSESNSHLVGSLDMGGASTQITFSPSHYEIIPSSYVQQLKLYGRTYQLYTHSYLCYGKKEAERRLMALLLADKLNEVRINHTMDNPCAPIGLVESKTISYITQSPCIKSPSSGWHINSSYVTISGTSNISQCVTYVKRLFNFTHCLSNNCSFNGVYQPPIKETPFVAFSSYYYVVDDLNLTGNGNLTLSKLKKTADKFCRQSWSQIIKGKSQRKATVFKTVCFDAQYIYFILKEGYHINDDTSQVHFNSKIHGNSLGWALGFMINATNLIPDKEPEYRVQTEAFLAVVIVGAILLSLGVFLMIMASRRVIDRWKYNAGPSA